MKLLLFDIDGIIVKEFPKGYLSGHRTGLKDSIRKVYGIDYIPKIDHGGMTDKEIFFEELKLHGLSESEIKSKINEVMNEMIAVFIKHDNSDLALIEGIKEILEKLSKSENILIGLLTGNAEEIAYKKLD